MAKKQKSFADKASGRGADADAVMVKYVKSVKSEKTGFWRFNEQMVKLRDGEDLNAALKRLDEASNLVDIDLSSFEATENPDSIVDLIKSCGCKVGISIKPSTPINTLYPYLDKIDVVLLMTVEPGFGGQGYLVGSNDRIRKLRKYLNDNCAINFLVSYN